MIEKRNIIRQIKDIQNQAERLIKRKSSLSEIEQFANYSCEIKSFLIKNIDEDFILKYVYEIPDLNLDESDSKPGFFDLILFSFNFGFGAYSKERQKADKALKTVRDIRGKYASLEFMLKNHFN